jgi:hypothetical protein
MNSAISVTNNNIAIYKAPKALHPGGIRTDDFLFLRRMRFHLATPPGQREKNILLT